MTGRRSAALVLVGLALAAGCDGAGDAGGTTSEPPPPSTTERPSTTAALPTTTTTLAATEPRPPSTGGAYSGIAQLVGFGGTCTAFLVDLGPLDQPASVLTTGRCVGLDDATTVLQDVPATDAVLRFGLLAGAAGAVVTVPVTAVAYASVRATDVAVLTLGATRQDLAGLPAYALGPPPPPPLGSPLEAVGVPSAGLPAERWLLRTSECVVASDGRLVEGGWLWDEAIGGGCAGILDGSSGSPLFVAGDATTAVGIVNTSTIGAPVGGTCGTGQPCQVAAGGVTEVPDQSYAMPLAGWVACWAPTFEVAVADCPAELPPVVTVDVPARTVGPGAPWAATIANGGPDRPVLVKGGPVATTDCRVADGYDDPAPADPARFLDAPLPSAEDLYVLCAARADADGAPSTADAGYAVVAVDATPPAGPVELAMVADDAGVRVEPVPNPPDQASFLLLHGPAGTVDCAAADQYVPYRGVPVVLPASRLPATLCVVAVDEVGNRGAPQSFPLP